MSNSIDAKIVVLGAQGVGKTSFVVRYVKNTFTTGQIPSTIGASFLTKRVVGEDGLAVKMQIWDTAGQERFRSISKLYYRGANAGILCYDITNAASFEEMGKWLIELRKNMPEDIIFHIVGTKADLVHADPSLRAVPFEQCIAFIAQQLSSDVNSLTVPSLTPAMTPAAERRGSGFWGQEAGWDTCHEISSLDGEGIDEVFRVIVRKLIEQKVKQDLASSASAQAQAQAEALRVERLSGGYDSDRGGQGNAGHASFRLGLGEHSRSWLRFPPGQVQIDGRDGHGETAPQPESASKARSGCCY